MILSMADHTHPHTHDYIDIYCERTGPEYWSEPVNAITNGAFLIAALMIFLFMRMQNRESMGGALLGGFIAAIGIGSFLFHTYASFITQMMDVIPIVLFQISFLILYSRHVMALKFWQVGVFVVAFLAVSYGFGTLPREWLNGSLSLYGSALVFVLGLGLYHLITKKPEPYVLLCAACTFVVSITFRAVDYAVCDIFPLGTHFLWHILNALVLYGCTRAYIVARREA